MKLRTIAATLLATALIGTATTAPTSASASKSPRTGDLGTTSLAEVLTSDGNTFDRNSADYDIVTEAVLAVLAEKPDSPVGLLADGNVALTAFVPNDWSFRKLVKDLTGKCYKSERRVFEELVAAVGVDNVEAVLLYHVIPGATIDSSAALKADGVRLQTALTDAKVKVDVIYPATPIVRLRDNDRNDTDPYLDPNALDLNKGNKQIAHGIIFVLRPLDL